MAGASAEWPQEAGQVVRHSIDERLTIIRGISVASILTAGFATAGVGQSYTCDNTTEDAIALRNYIVELVTAPATDTAVASNRQRYQLPAGSQDIVTFESNAKVCAAAGAAYHAPASSTKPPAERSRLIVVKVGDDRYVVLDPDHRSPRSEFLTVVIFDSEWNDLAAFTS